MQTNLNLSLQIISACVTLWSYLLLRKDEYKDEDGDKIEDYNKKVIDSVNNYDDENGFRVRNNLIKTHFEKVVNRKKK